MAYIGVNPAKGNWRKLTDISAGFNGVTTSFTLSVPPGTSSYYVTPASPYQLFISLGGVIQQPDIDFTVSTNTITFTTAPTAGLSFFGILAGDSLSIGTPSDGTVTTSKLGSNLSFGLTGGSASTPAIYFTGDTSTGLYSPGAAQVAISTGGSGRLFVDSSGRVGIGTTAPSTPLHIGGATDKSVRVDSSNGNAAFYGIFQNEAQLTVNRDGATGTFTDTGKSAATLTLEGANGGSTIRFATASANNTGPSERARIDSSGRLLVGTSTARANFYGISARVQSEAAADQTGRNTALIYGRSLADGPLLTFAKHRSDSVGGQAIIQSGDICGELVFTGSDGANFQPAAHIKAEIDGTPGTNDMPGRLVFSVTRDNEASPTEAMRINSDRDVFIGTTTVNPGIGNTTAGVMIRGGAGSNGNYIAVSRSGGTPLIVNRSTNDGVLVSLLQDGTEEGNISVSGTTVSYNGAHLSRWSQLPGNAERVEILRGTVLSNIDEMCEWGDEENEQLNRMKVSDVEGEKNVAGVFQGWDDDDDTYTNDFYCAMTGDFVIRIAAGVTVERGDLLMSAGDGTAKPQDDDIIRSKTIAKVTSTTVSCTYEDGSYCVPCVLMAC